MQDSGTAIVRRKLKIIMISAVSIFTLLVSTISHVREWNADCEFEYKRALSVCLPVCWYT